MNLGVILSIGDGFYHQQKSGQLTRFTNYYLKSYSQSFDKVFIFEYEGPKHDSFVKSISLPSNCVLVSNRFRIHRYLYQFLLPLVHWRLFLKCDTFRVMQATGVVPAVIAKICFRKPFIVTYGFDYVEFAQIEQQLGIVQFIKPVLTLGLFFADKIIVTSSAIKTLLNRKGYSSKIAWIPNGVDTNLIKPKHKTRKKNTVLLFIGRLEKQKNLDQLIMAVALSKYQNAIILRLIGTGSLKKNLLKLAKEVGVNLEISDPVDYQYIPSILSKADIFALVSHIEGHPKVLLEAMSAGLPVIGSNVKGIKGILKDKETGIIVKPVAESIAYKVDYLISHSEEAKRLGKNAREFVLKNYNLRNLIVDEIELLKRYVK